ncbi:MAG: hypothetical protein Q4G70_01355 [Pseudomonadota bacterium]|nr:hypothetical protein [Pseudomonadota bacterium]
MTARTWRHGARSILEMPGDGCYEFTIRVPSSGIACGMVSGTDAGGPEDIEHGFFVLDEQYCVVESGAAKTPWLSLPSASLLVFRIYRINEQVVYTVGDGGYWPDYTEEGDNPYYLWSAEQNIVRGALVSGTLVHQGAARTARPAFLYAAFSAEFESIFNARLLDVRMVTASAHAVAPAWRAAGTDVTDNAVAARMPPWHAASSDVDGNYAVARMPPWRTGAGGSVLDMRFNEVRSAAPAWRNHDPYADMRPARSPAWRTRASGQNGALSAQPAWRSYGGDSINTAAAIAPAWRAQSVAPRSMVGLAYGQVLLPVALAPLVIDDGMLPTVPLRGVLGGAMVPFAVPRLRAVLGGGGCVRGRAVLTTAQLRGVLGGGGAAGAVRRLRTAALDGRLTANTTLGPARFVLATQAMRLLATGRLGGRAVNADVYALSMGETGGTTHYTNYDFDSFARIGDHYYGCRHDGLYVLDGADDAGTPIGAAFGLGQLDFGNPQLKTVAHCYLGASAGAMHVRIDALLHGQPSTYTYPAGLRRHGLVQHGQVQHPHHRRERCADVRARRVRRVAERQDLDRPGLRPSGCRWRPRAHRQLPAAAAWHGEQGLVGQLLLPARRGLSGGGQLPDHPERRAGEHHGDGEHAGGNVNDGYGGGDVRVAAARQWYDDQRQRKQLRRGEQWHGCDAASHANQRTNTGHDQLEWHRRLYAVAGSGRCIA